LDATTVKWPSLTQYLFSQKVLSRNRYFKKTVEEYIGLIDSNFTYRSKNL
jgi:hypothetical protein